MPRRPKPWERSDGRGWFIKLDGEQIPLGKDKAEAHDRFHRLMADHSRAKAAGKKAPPRAEAPLLASEVVSLFLFDCQAAVGRGELEPVTLEGYERFLRPAVAAFGHLPAPDLRPHHVLAWLAAPKASGRPWGPTTRRNAVVAVKRAFRWAQKAGHLAESPVADLQAPTAESREAVPTPAEYAALRAQLDGDGPFAELLAAIHGTGCRPGEVYRLEASMLRPEEGAWVIPNKTRRKTRKKTRRVMVPAGVMAVCVRKAAERPEGPIYRNRSGNPWTRNCVAWRLARLRKKLGLGPEVAANALRHLFATDAAIEGLPPRVTAALMGHTSSKMVDAVYSHVEGREQELREALRKIRDD